jgi:hypothetical protein
MTMAIDTLTTLAEIAMAKGQSKRSIEIAAIKKQWPYTEVNSRSGYKRRLFALADLPEGIRTAVIAARISAAINAETKEQAGEIRLVVDSNRRVDINLVDGMVDGKIVIKVSHVSA